MGALGTYNLLLTASCLALMAKGEGVFIDLSAAPVSQHSPD